MKLKIDWAQKKEINVNGTPRKILEGTFIGDNDQRIEATIWREDRDGKIFPDFDALAPGHEFEANPWLNPKTGKYSLYAPKIEAKGNFAPNKGAMMTKVMETKKANISEAQDRKEQGIEISGSARDATLILTTFYADKDLTDEDIQSKWLEWRKWLLNNYGLTDKPPFN